MTTTERRDELATLRLLGGTTGHAIRMLALEMLPIVAVGLGAGATIVAIAVSGIPHGVTGFPLVVPLELAAGLAAGALALGMLAVSVATRLAQGVTPAEAMRAKE